MLKAAGSWRGEGAGREPGAVTEGADPAHRRGAPRPSGPGSSGAISGAGAGAGTGTERGRGQRRRWAERGRPG